MTVGAGALALAAIAGCASGAPYNPEALAGGEIGRISQVCQVVVGLVPMEAHYDGCIDALSQSVRVRNEAHRLTDARSACVAEGKRVGAALDVCELQKAEADPRHAGDDDPGPTPVSVTAPAKSYFWASPRASRHRERLACAELGFEPATSAFDSCVAGLAAAMFDADNPAH